MRKILSKLLALTLCVALGLGMVGSAFAAEPATGKFDLETVCTDDGQYVSKVIINLDEATTATAEELKEAFTVKVEGYSRNFYGWPIEGDFDRTIVAVEVSEDGKTVTLELDIGGIFPATLAYKGDFAAYTETGYVVAAEGFELEFSGVMTDPLADKWGAVDLTDTEYNYRWYDPSADYTMPETGYPLIVWLHGAGESGTDNVLQITANRVTAWGEPETQDLFGGAYVLAPQMDQAKAAPGTWGWNPEVVMATIEAFIKSVGEANVDRSRIVVGGCSMGGAGTWNTIIAYPDYFAAAFPICGSATGFNTDATIPAETVIALKALPIYCIHTVEDGTVNIQNTLNAYDALTAAGKANIYLALYEHTWTIGAADETPEDLVNLSYNGHSSWIYAHNDFDGEKLADKYWLETFDYTVGEGESAVTTTYASTKPAELGYASFKAWLAGQVRPETGVYFTVEREVVAFGEIVRSVTIHNLERISALTKLDDWVKTNKVSIQVVDVATFDYATGEMKVDNYIREWDGLSTDETRTTVTFTFPTGEAFIDPTTGVTNKYLVTMGGDEIPYGGDSNPQVEEWEEVTYTVPEYQYNDATMTTMSARAFTPDKETYGADSYPLIIWLHGVGELGADNRIQITANDVVAWGEKESQDVFGGAYVLAIQNHAAISPDACMSVIRQFMAEKGDIDATRVYIGGCSMGGGATWTMIKNHPTFFAAAFPICMGGSLTETDAANLANLPIYMTVSSGDSAGIVTGMIESYNALKAAGNEKVYISIFEHSGYEGYEGLAAVGMYIDHFSWVYAHLDYDAKGEDYDGEFFIDTSADGEYNNGAVVIKEGILSYSQDVTTDWYGNPLEEPYTLSATLNGVNNRPEDAGYATFKAFIADQTNENPSPFIDVTAGDECYEAVAALYDAGLTNGTSANTYEPDATLTRSEFVTFLARAAKADIDPNAEATFDDLTQNWYFGTVAWAVEKGLIQGYGDGKFGPEDEVTTEQVNLIVKRLLAKDSSFTAADGQLFENGDATPATRGQVASIINALVENHK